MFTDIPFYVSGNNRVEMDDLFQFSPTDTNQNKIKNTWNTKLIRNKIKHRIQYKYKIKYKYKNLKGAKFC